jgi:hypothetical protein
LNGPFFPQPWQISEYDENREKRDRE